MSRFHSDTTTISFYGEYDIDVESMDLTESEKLELLEIERGYNKDGRPDRKQVAVGQITNELGVPLVSHPLDGSTSDIEWNKTAIGYMKTLQITGFTDGAYVADSKLVTTGLFESMMEGENRVTFVSRCPTSFANKLESRTISKAYKDGTWTELGQYGECKKASSYRHILYRNRLRSSVPSTGASKFSSFGKKRNKE